MNFLCSRCFFNDGFISYFIYPLEMETIIFDCSNNDKVPLLN